MAVDHRHIPPGEPLRAATLSNSADRRAQVQRELEERAAERYKQLALQTSPLNGPEERIRIWERLHALRLPSSSDHKLVRIIAAQTELTVRQVQQEQLRRRGITP